jgi:hypothetical protein
MFRKRGICSAIAAALITVSGAALAGVVAEDETSDPTKPNNPIDKAQPLIIDASGGVTVKGQLGTADPSTSATLLPDLDYYSFDGREGDVVTVDIDYGIKPAGQRSVDTMIAIFGPGPGYLVLRMNDDGGLDPTGDPETMSSADSKILNFRLPASGTYVVGVSSFPRAFVNGGGVNRTTLSSRSNGAYDLVITGVTPSIQHINVDIRPGNDKPAPLNPKSRGVIPVALLSSSEFDPLTVNQDSLTFGSTGKESTLQRCNKDNVDLNGDGKPDLVCHFENSAAGFDEGDLEGVVMGTFGPSNRMFEGRGLLKIVPRGSK